jgi:hypothetical protein
MGEFRYAKYIGNDAIVELLLGPAVQYRDGLITEDEAVEKFREHMLKYANYEYKNLGKEK